MEHKPIARDIQFFDENGIPVADQIQQADNAKDTCNALYPIKYKRDDKEKILRLQNDGEDFTVSSVLDELSLTSIQQASDCFRLGRFIKQFRRICGPESPTSVSANSWNTDYSLINSLSSAEDNEASRDSQYGTSRHIDTDSGHDNIVCDISIQADKLLLCQAEQAHEVVHGNTDASLFKEFLATSEAPHLDTKALIQKLDEVAKTVDFDVSTILAEQIKHPIFGTLRSWIRKNTPPMLNRQRSNSLKVFYSIVKSLTDFLLKKKDSNFGTLSPRTS